MSLFVNYFNKKGGFELEKPKQPLVAVIFESFDDYAKVVGKYIPADMIRNVPGIYIPRVNRMFTYNAFGGQMETNLRVLANQSPSAAEQASTHLIEQNVSTLVHEAIHHVAYNSGLHNRSVQQQA